MALTWLGTISVNAINIVGAAHCQKGQYANVYEIIPAESSLDSKKGGKRKTKTKKMKKGAKTKRKRMTKTKTKTKRPHFKKCNH